MKTGIELITEERQRQIEVEGWTPEHDAKHAFGEAALHRHRYDGEQLQAKADVLTAAIDYIRDTSEMLEAAVSVGFQRHFLTRIS